MFQAMRIDLKIVNKAFTLAELLVGMVVLLLIVAALQRFFFASVRGSQHKQEVVDHVRTASILFRSIADDMLGIFPRGYGNDKKPISYVPAPPKKANEFSFWKMVSMNSIESFRFISYKIVKSTKVSQDGVPLPGDIIREEFDKPNGELIRKDIFGSGIVDDFEVFDEAGDSSQIRVQLSVRGKLRTKVDFVRFYSADLGMVTTEAQYWNYSAN